jgi:hypothetical protein
MVIGAIKAAAASMFIDLRIAFSSQQRPFCEAAVLI